jgi:hypothetical protein
MAYLTRAERVTYTVATGLKARADLYCARHSSGPERSLEDLLWAQNAILGVTCHAWGVKGGTCSPALTQATQMSPRLGSCAEELHSRPAEPSR